MAFLVKLCLLFIGLASISSAISIPITLNAGREQNSSSLASNALGGGNVQASVDINRCKDGENNGWSVINFGDRPNKEVCWSISTNNEATLISENELTDLFKKYWNKSTSTWSDNNKQGINWKTVCGSSNGWVIVAESAKNEEYLGECEWSTGNSKSFIEKKRENSNTNVIKLSICSGNCLTTQKTGNFKQLGVPKTGNWHPITFKSKNTNKTS